MKIVEKLLSEVTPNPENPRFIDKAVPNIAQSIKEFGFKVPIVINAQGVIIAGHARYAAAQKLGMEKIPCVVADDLNERQQKAFMVADNKVAEGADFDFEKLRVIFADLDLLNTDLFVGFNADEIQGLMEIDTSFLDDIEKNGDDSISDPNTIQTPNDENKGDVPVFRIQLALFDEQKEKFFDAINAVKKLKGKEAISNSEAVAFICETYLGRKKK